MLGTLGSRPHGPVVPDASETIFEDNYFDLAPGQTRAVTIVDLAGSSEIVVRAYNADPVSVERHESSGMGEVS